MDITTTPPTTSKAMFWTGWVISAIPVLFMLGGGLFFLLFKVGVVKEGMVKYGYPENAAVPILMAEIICAAIYLLPRTAVLGAILLTGYLGGAVATHVHAGEPFFFPVIFGLLVWLGLFLRDTRVRALVPFRKNADRFL